MNHVDWSYSWQTHNEATIIIPGTVTCLIWLDTVKELNFMLNTSDFGMVDKVNLHLNK